LDSNSTKTTEKFDRHLGGDLFTNQYVVNTPVLTDMDQEINMNQETWNQGTMKRFLVLMLTSVETQKKKKHFYFPLHWLANRDPFHGLE